jgi:hypothetical protein
MVWIGGDVVGEGNVQLADRVLRRDVGAGRLQEDVI